jgi:large subunit ribosomal protein L37Ae
MTVKRKKIKAAGRFGTGYGKIKGRLNAVEDKQRKHQECPFCISGKPKRKSKGIWECKKCSKLFAGGVFIINK